MRIPGAGRPREDPGETGNRIRRRTVGRGRKTRSMVSRSRRKNQDCGGLEDRKTEGQAGPGKQSWKIQVKSRQEIRV